MKVAAAVALVVLVSSPAKAQNWEVSGLFGSIPSVNLERRAPELTQLDIAGGTSWGVQAARFLTPHWGGEVLWTRQESELEAGTAAGIGELFEMRIRQLHGNAVYRFGAAGARWQPFAFAGLGATFFSADDIPSETKFALNLGGGLKYFPWPSLGFRGHFRYTPTMLNDESSGDFCDPFGFCNGALRQVEMAGGVVLRF